MKIIKKRNFIIISIMLIVSIVLSACSNYNFKPTIEYQIEDFKMIDHRGETVTLDSLKGQPWIAMFIFTNCNTICQPMTLNMSIVQEKLKEKGLEDYKIVGFSVDPARDTPEVLSKYLKFFTVPDESKWHLLTGYDQKFIEQFALKSFKTLVKMPEDGDQVIHGSSFYLVDENGVAVKLYSGYSEEENSGQAVPYDEIAIDIETLINNMKKK
ncbi:MULTISPECIES: SCO family protein [Ureibacillus]|jgi:protein SCO1|uniref:Protein SCO1/2 n=1 Tax=Ureibacillus thermosphaericus TaxID=51173 RepID=A0A840PRZ0_URETH|nr:SCO family protein [Ureibacillus thermosphaericus]MBB5148587.1 protein SCO1/2 [Ureibacillus thermosphaericus]NKZ31305.1 SCO family protein [Ureibacillus thermosphaericus]